MIRHIHKAKDHVDIECTEPFMLFLRRILREHKDFLAPEKDKELEEYLTRIEMYFSMRGL